MTAPKLDKSHGFMQSIIKNQVSRDEYDKEMKILASEKKFEERYEERQTGPVKTVTKRNRTPRREAKQLYVPPHLKNRGAERNGEQS